MKPTLSNKNDLVILANQKTEQREYWESKLSARNDLTHFIFDQIGSNTEPEYDQFETQFSNETNGLISKISAKADLKLFTVLLSGVSYIISKYTGTDLVSIGTPVFNQNNITPFLVLNNEIVPGMTFRQLLNQSKMELKSVNGNSEYPIELLCEKLGFNKGNSTEPRLFDISLTLDNTQDYSLVESHQANANIRFHKNEDALILIVDYNRNVYSETFIGDLAKKIERFFSKVLLDLDTNLNQISLIDEAEQAGIAAITTGPNLTIDHTFVNLFEEAVSKYADVVAVSDETQTLTYSQLLHRSNEVANYLITHSIEVKEIGVLHHRNVNLLVYLLGILKAGKTFVPLNPDDPTERLSYILENSGSGLVITDQEYLSLKTDFIDYCKENNIGLLSELALDKGTTTSLEDLTSADSVAYIIYTSGTTGRPKGVPITHSNLSNYLYWAADQYLGNADDCMALHSNIAFDMSITTMFAPLIHGNEVICYEERPNQFTIEQVIEDNRTTVLKLTPSHLKLMLHKFDKTEQKFRTLLSNLSLKKIIVGGEELEENTAREITELFDGKIEILNEYGPTEATVGCLVHNYDPMRDKTASLSIGTPINNMRVFVLGEEQDLLPKGFVGELYIAGQSVAGGYVNNKSLSEERFVTLSEISDEVLYRTGDRVSLLPNDKMIYLGRKDEQVKVRGYRVELGEIRKQIASNAEVDTAEVIVKEDQEGSKYLTCYYTSTNGMDKATLKEYSTERLPEYMVPLHFMRLDEMPLSASGKLNKKALPKIENDQLQSLNVPKNALEEELLVFWKETLENDQIGTQSNFYQVGGDSIRAIRLIAKLNKAYKIKLVIADLFSNPTIVELSAVIKSKEGASEDKLLSKTRREVEDLKAEILEAREDSAEIEDIYPVSDIQLGMIFHSRKEEDGALYHDQMIEHMAYSNFNFDRFENALAQMVSKHSILRTSFDLRSHRKPVQIVYNKIDFDLQQYNLAHLSHEEQMDHIREYAEDDKTRPFDMMQLPLWRIRVFVLNDREIIVLWVVHHALIDGWSDASFKTELHNTYELLGTDTSHQVSPLKAVYKDYVLEELSNKNNDKLRSFWTEEISASVPIRFGNPSEIKDKLSVGFSSFNLTGDINERLGACAVSMGVDVKTLFFAAYLLSIKTLTRQNDLTVGLVANNRPEIEDGDKVLGCFLNTLPFRIDLEETSSYIDIVQAVHAKLKRLQEYKQSTLQEIKNLRWKKSSQDTFLFDTMFNYMDFHIYQSAIQRDRQDNDELGISDWSVTNYTLTLNVGKVMDGYEIEMVYHHGAVSPLAGEFCEIMKRSLEFMVDQPGAEIAWKNLFKGNLDTLFDGIHWNKRSYDDVEIWELLKQEDKVATGTNVESSQTEVLSDTERTRILESFNDTEVNYPLDETVISVFERRAAESPDLIALRYEDETMTYSELGELVTKVSSYLIQQYDVRPGQLVGVMLEREKYMIPCIYAIIKAGAAYVPIDPDFPEERQKLIMEEAELSVVITREEYWKTSEESSLKVLDLNKVTNDMFEVDSIVDFPVISNEDLIYVLYTSGSTGRPKGVMIEHQVMRNVHQYFQRVYPLNSKDVLLLKTPIVFDISVWELFWWPYAGASLSILAPGHDKDPERMIATIARHQVSVINFVPSMLNIFLSSLSQRSAVDQVSSLRYVLAGGEVLTPKHITLFRQQLFDIAGTQLVNVYGPTEANLVSSHNCDFSVGYSSTPIGGPIDNAQLFVLDDDLQPVPVGVSGEIYVSGTCLGRGYLNNPELTQAKFIDHPFEENQKCYGTGDLGRFLENGELDFIERIDNQVKLRGYRIELSEIEYCLEEHDEVQEAAVVCTDKNTSPFLVAYYVSDEELSVSELKKTLAQSLPEYMVPAYYQHLKSIPLTSNGKRNTKLLADFKIELEHQYVPPTDQVEKDLVEIWSEVLNIESDQISIDAEVFDLGGTSLTLMLLMDKIHWQFGYKLSIDELFNENRVAEIATRIRANLVLADDFDDESVDKIVI